MRLRQPGGVQSRRAYPEKVLDVRTIRRIPLRRGEIRLSICELVCPHLFQRQLKDGAWGITVATTQQLRIARSYGVARVIMANQLVDPQGIRYVLAEMKREIWNGLFQTLAEATDAANADMQKSFTSEDFKEGVAHFVEKRAPAFTGR